MNINRLNRGSDASAILNWSRFIAAFLVFALHLTRNSIIPGYQAVMVFFVLSGFFISSSVLHSMQAGKWSWGYYLTSRVVRLWVVLIPALILSAVWVNIQLKLFGSSGLPTFSGGTVGSNSISSLFQNLCFLQGIFTPDLFGYNGPLWSLSFEFWYYILFPVMILSVTSKKALTKVVYGAIFIAISLILGIQIMAFYIIWLLGALLAISKPMAFVKKHAKLSLILSAILAIVSLQALYIVFRVTRPYPDMTHYLPDLSVAVCFSLFVYAVIHTCSSNSLLAKWGSVGTYLAGMSYTLYLVHYPLLNFLNASGIFSENNKLIKLALFFTTLIFVLLYADLISHVTERHTTKIKKFILEIGKKEDKSGLYDVKD